MKTIVYRFIIDDEGRFLFEKISDSEIIYKGDCNFQYNLTARWIERDYSLEYIDNDYDVLVKIYE